MKFQKNRIVIQQVRLGCSVIYRVGTLFSGFEKGITLQETLLQALGFLQEAHRLQVLIVFKPCFFIRWK